MLWTQLGTVTIALIGLIGSVVALRKERQQEKEQLGVEQLELALKTQQAQLDRQDQQIMAKDAKIEAQSAKIDTLNTRVEGLSQEVMLCHREKNDLGIRLDQLQLVIDRMNPQ